MGHSVQGPPPRGRCACSTEQAHPSCGDEPGRTGQEPHSESAVPEEVEGPGGQAHSVQEGAWGVAEEPAYEGRTQSRGKALDHIGYGCFSDESHACSRRNLENTY